MNTTRSGFAVLEVLIAIALIGIVAAGTFGAVRLLGKAKLSRTKTTLRMVRAAIESFNSDTTAYPMSLQDLITRPAEEKIAKRWEGPYVQQAERADVKDGWGNELQYRVNQKGSGRSYELYSWGKDGEGSPSEEWIDVWFIE